MRIKLLSDQFYGCRLHKEGSIIDCRLKRAKELIEEGVAVVVSEEKEIEHEEDDQTIEE